MGDIKMKNHGRVSYPSLRKEGTSDVKTEEQTGVTDAVAQG